MAEHGSREDLYSQLILAVNDGNILAVRQLAIEYKFSHNNKVESDLNEILREAIRTEQNEIAEILIDIGADIGREDSFGRRVIHIAADSQNVVVLRLLNRAGTAINAVDCNGMSALHISLLHGYRDVSLYLIESGATVNRPRRYDTGEAPMHFAAQLGDAVVMAAALRRGAGRPDVQSSDGLTPLHIAARESHGSCVDLMCAAAQKKAINCVDNSCLTPLHCGVKSSALDVVRILLRNGADPNAADRNGLTPLHYAAAVTNTPTYSHSGVIDLLISHGANIDARDSQHRTPLHLASAVGNSGLVRLLASSGADVDAVERILGETAINIAAAYGRYDVINELCMAGCDVNICDRHGVAPLYKLLSTAGNTGPFKYTSTDVLLRHGARVNLADERGVTPLQACIFHTIISRSGSDGLPLLRRLASAGAHLRQSPASGQRSIRNSPLCWLIWHGELSAAAFLINAGWQLRGEHWLALPGKTADIERFLISVRKIACTPDTMRDRCRSVIRRQLLVASEDRDIVPRIEQLPIPKQIQQYLALESEMDML